MSEPTDDKIVWFKDAPNRSPIKSFTTQELINELCKRDGVEEIKVKETDSYFLSFGRNGSSTHRYRQGGEATILVVNKG